MDFVISIISILFFPVAIGMWFTRKEVDVDDFIDIDA